MLRRVLRALLLVATFGCGLCALALLSLPLMLALLMLLFDSTAQGVMVLLGAIAGWFRWASAGGSGLPVYRGLSLDPAAIALAAGLRMVPCVAGMALPILLRTCRPGWLAVAGLWLLAALVDGRLVGMVLAPGVVSALLLASPLGSIDAPDRLAA